MLKDINPADLWPAVRASIQAEMAGALPVLKDQGFDLSVQETNDGAALQIKVATSGKDRATGELSLSEQDLVVRFSEEPFDFEGQDLVDYREACRARDLLSAILLGMYESFDIDSVDMSTLE